MKRILIYGDSNTWGYNLHASHPVSGAGLRYLEDVRWPCIMADKLGSGYKIYEEGFCGRTTVFEDPLAAGRNGLSTLAAIYGTCSPVDLVIIMLGTNDTKDMFCTDALTITEGMGRLVNELKYLISHSNSPDAKILIINPARLTPCEDGSFMYGFSQRSCRISEELGARLETFAAQNSCCFFDANSIEGVQVDPGDGTHLTPEAHRALGCAVADKVQEILG